MVFPTLRKDESFEEGRPLLRKPYKNTRQVTIKISNSKTPNLPVSHQETIFRYKLHRPSNGRGIMTAADSADKLDDIRKCIVSGLFPNAAYLHMSGNYRYELSSEASQRS